MVGISNNDAVPNDNNDPPPPPNLDAPDGAVNNARVRYRRQERGAAAAPRNNERVAIGQPPVVEMERLGDDVVEGGVAGALSLSGVVYHAEEEVNPSGGSSSRRRSRDCDLVLLIECGEDIQSSPSALGRKGTTVSIGLEKTTKLHTVFNRFALILTHGFPSESIDVSSLEFIHSEILSGKETAEGSALMKNDRIFARKRKTKERESEMEMSKFQKDTDRVYLKQMRGLLPEFVNDVGGEELDCNYVVILECRGRLVENGVAQCLNSALEVHSSIVSKRCKWLGVRIREARDEQKRKDIITIPTDNNQSPYEQTSDNSSNTIHPREDVEEKPTDDTQEIINEDDDENAVQPYPLMHRHRNNSNNNQIVAEVVAEEGDVPPSAKEKLHNVTNDTSTADDFNDSTETTSCSPIITSPCKSQQNRLWVTLDHPPEAVKLLLEYCYTNRCLPLGQGAFMETSSKGAVSPYHYAGWPNNGKPRIAMSVALRGIQLAEEVNIPRFSLMCEVAAADLITKHYILECLSLCTSQQKRTGNKLMFLRKAAMDYLLKRNGILSDLSSQEYFKRGLIDDRDNIVPSLLLGTREIVFPSNQKKSKQKPSKGSHRRMEHLFQKLDESDKRARSSERSKHRQKRQKINHHLMRPANSDDSDTDEHLVAQLLHSYRSNEDSGNEGWGPRAVANNNSGWVTTSTRVEWRDFNEYK